MPLPPDQRIKFFVFVIESPSPVDLYHRRSEGDIIQQAASLNQIPCVVKTSINFQAFEAALKIGLKETMDDFPHRIPMLHISAHGFEEGIQLSSGEIVHWGELETLLIPINAAFGGSLLLCLSCCEGYSGIRMAMSKEERPQPFFALISNGQKPLWSDTAVAYSTFYHLVAKGYYLTDAVKAMQAASGNDMFWIETAANARQTYLDHVLSVDTEEAHQALEQNAQSESPEHRVGTQKPACPVNTEAQQ
jgi:hypothetical protein